MFALLILGCVDYGFHDVDPLEEPELRTDFFAVEAPPGLDVLFVLDASCSMDVELQRFQDGLDGLVAGWLEEDVDVRVAVAATDPTYAPTGWLRPDASGDIGLRRWPEASTRAHHEGLMEALEAIERLDWEATSGRQVVFYADDDDRSPVPAVARFDAVAALEALRVHALVRPPGVSCADATGVGARYAAAAEASGGTVVDLCGDLEVLEVVGEGIGTRTRFPLSTRPRPETIRVRVSDVVGIERLTEIRAAAYDPETNEVVLEEGARTRQEVRIDYQVADPA